MVKIGIEITPTMNADTMYLRVPPAIQEKFSLKPTTKFNLVDTIDEDGKVRLVYEISKR